MSEKCGEEETRQELDVAPQGVSPSPPPEEEVSYCQICGLSET